MSEKGKEKSGTHRIETKGNMREKMAVFIGDLERDCNRASMECFEKCLFQIDLEDGSQFTLVFLGKTPAFPDFYVNLMLHSPVELDNKYTAHRCQDYLQCYLKTGLS
ncbi:Hypothetical predicted protein [Octopus vulgaris]|uniref:Uncharacterized protein n=1 Tax=Octopus vulgaris TaxID=6645 RepID=A0AA36FJJ7_OCTVU|nr:Hypothetical predicted protein [Octopus vulgaris]